MSPRLSFLFLIVLALCENFWLTLKTNTAHKSAASSADPKQYHRTITVLKNYKGKLHIWETKLKTSSVLLASVDIKPKIYPSANSLFVALELLVSFLYKSALTKFLAFQPLTLLNWFLCELPNLSNISFAQYATTRPTPVYVMPLLQCSPTLMQSMRSLSRNGCRQLFRTINNSLKTRIISSYLKVVQSAYKRGNLLPLDYIRDSVDLRWLNLL